MVFALGCWVLLALNVRLLWPSLLCPSYSSFAGTPSYIERIRPGKFPQVLRSLHIPAIIFNTVLMLLILAIVPLNEILGGANVLSTLAQYVRV